MSVQLIISGDHYTKVSHKRMLTEWQGVTNIKLSLKLWSVFPNQFMHTCNCKTLSFNGSFWCVHVWSFKNDMKLNWVECFVWCLASKCCSILSMYTSHVSIVSSHGVKSSHPLHPMFYIWIRYDQKYFGNYKDAWTQARRSLTVRLLVKIDHVTVVVNKLVQSVVHCNTLRSTAMVSLLYSTAQQFHHRAP